jgi:hypothetical protein
MPIDNIYINIKMAINCFVFAKQLTALSVFGINGFAKRYAKEQGKLASVYKNKVV